MKNALLAGIAAIGVAVAAPGAWAAPTCLVTDTVTNGESVSGAFLLGAGNCVAAGDKIFGDFAATGFSGAGSAVFSFFPGTVTIGFQGSLGPNSVGTLDYSVAVDPLLSQGYLINGIEQDFTMTSIIPRLGATATITGITVPPPTNPPVLINCTRTVNPSSGTCPVASFFDAVSELSIHQELTTGANSVVTALTDTIFQGPPSVPEPASLGLLGVGLLGLAGIAGRKRRTY